MEAIVLMRSGLLCLTLGFVLALTLGCDGTSKPLKEAQRDLEYNLKEMSEPSYSVELLPGREYNSARKRAALEYLKGRHSLEKPYTVSAVWSFAMPGMEDGRSEMGVQWIEGETHVVGVVLSSLGKEGKRQWMLPVFEWLQVLLARPEAAPYRETALRMGRIRFFPSDLAEPTIRSVNRGADCPPVEVVIPKSMVGPNLEVGVCDDKGNVSNLVPVFIWPGEPYQTYQTKKP